MFRAVFAIIIIVTALFLGFIAKRTVDLATQQLQSNIEQVINQQ